MGGTVTSGTGGSLPPGVDPKQFFDALEIIWGDQKEQQERERKRQRRWWHRGVRREGRVSRNG